MKRIAFQAVCSVSPCRSHGLCFFLRTACLADASHYYRANLLKRAGFHPPRWARLALFLFTPATFLIGWRFQ
jgi:hypothetical protein